MEIFFKKNHPKQRVRGNKIAGRGVVMVIFLCLTAINAAALATLPYLGVYADSFLAALLMATVWAAILLVAIWQRQGWARWVLAVFLLGFVALQLVYIQDVMERYPDFRVHCLRLILLHWVTHIAAAVYLIVSVDIQWLSRPEIND